MDRIDAYTHVMPERSFERMREVHPTRELENFADAPHLFDIDRRIRDMDRHGIDRQVLTLAAPMIWRGLDPDEALPLARQANTELREIADRHPDRFIPVGTVPFPGERYAAEAERCIDDLEMAGVQVFSTLGDAHLDDPRVDPVLDAVAGETPLWIHPQLQDWHAYGAEDTWLYKALGWPFDTGVALARMAYSGVFDAHPDLEVVAHHMGGIVPYLEERLASFHRSRVELPEMYTSEDVADRDDPLGTLRAHVHGDTAVSCLGGTRTFDCGRDFFGEKGLVFASDYPHGPREGRTWLAETVDMVEDRADRADAVLGGNMADLLDR